MKQTQEMHKSKEIAQQSFNSTVKFEPSQPVSKLPKLSYKIEAMEMLYFKNMYFLLVIFENKSVQVYDYATGHFFYEFSFLDNTLEKFKSRANEKNQEEEMDT